MTLNGNNYLAIATTGSLPNLGGNNGNTYTIGVWVNTTLQGASLLSKGNGAWNASGDETFYLNNASGNSASASTGPYMGGVEFSGSYIGGGTAAVNTGTWQFVSVVRSSNNTSSVYVNGVLEASGMTNMGLAEQGTQNIYIGWNMGNHDGSVGYSGSISGVYVYNSALTQAQLQSVMAAGPSGVLLPGSLPSTTPVSITAAGAGLDVDGTQQTIASLSGVAGANVYLGGGALTVANSGGSTTYSGNIRDSGGALERRRQPDHGRQRHASALGQQYLHRPNDRQSRHAGSQRLAGQRGNGQQRRHFGRPGLSQQRHGHSQRAACSGQSAGRHARKRQLEPGVGSSHGF